jgi:O-antigen/teichoic acid export membrane protein
MAQFGHLLSGAAWNISGKIVQLALSLVALGLIARLVGPHAYGIFAIGWLVVGLFEVVVSSAPMDTLVQRRQASPGHFNATFVASLAMSLLIVAVIWHQAAEISGWLDGGEVLAAILPLRAATLPLMALAVGPAASLLRASRFKALAAAETFASAVSNLVGIGMALAGAGIWSLVGMELARAGVAAVCLIVLSRWRPGMRFRLTDVRDLLAFNASTWTSWGLGYLTSQLPRLVLASTLGVHAVGVFALAQRLYDQVTNILMIPAYQVVQAGIARSQDDRSHAKQLAEGTLRITGLLACPLFLGLAALAPVLVPTIFGAAWLDAITVVQIMMLLGIHSSMSIVQAAVVRGMGKPHWDLISALVVALLTAVLVVVAAPYGLEAATAAVVVSALAIWPLDALFVRRLTGLSAAGQIATSWRAGLAAAVMACGVWSSTPLLLSHLPPAAMLLLQVVFGAVLYWAMLRVLMPAVGKVISGVVLAVARRDFGAVRASLGSLAG